MSFLQRNHLFRKVVNLNPKFLWTLESQLKSLAIRNEDRFLRLLFPFMNI